VQCGAQPDEASNTLTRRTATYNWPLIRAHGFNADADWLRIEHGQSAGAAAVTASDWSRSRTRRGAATVAGADWTRTAEAADIGTAICPDRLRIRRDCFADAKTSF